MVWVLIAILMAWDMFDSGRDDGERLIGLIMHSMPALLLLLLLAIAWKRAMAGVIGYSLAGLVYLALLIRNGLATGFEWRYLIWALQISGLAFMTAGWYFSAWLRNGRRRRHKTDQGFRS